MATWTDFEVAAPEIAGKGRDLLYRTGAGEGLFVTIRGDGLPRAHPVNVGVVDGHLYIFVQAKSAKRRDLAEDGRYALHAYVIPEAPHEFLLRGRARLIKDENLRRMIASDWFFTVSDAYPLYELLISNALLGYRPTADDWPPVYSSWNSD
jgi:pyridoxamine 5'-phosphate oxidase-like protein